MKKILSAVVAAVYFSVNCALVHSAEANFWSSRRVASQQVKGETAQLEEGATVQRGNVLLAQLPMASPVDLARGKVDTAQAPGDAARTPFSIGPAAGDWLGKMVSPYGSVRNVYISPKKDAPFIVHIQDGHGIEEAQRNISSMIEIVGQDPKINLVGLEAAWGPFSLQPYRDYPDANITKEIADFFLKKGLIAGPEYAGLTLSKSPDFFGAENKELYDANVQALKTAYKTKQAAHTQLSVLVNNVANLKNQRYSDQLKIFDAHFEGYHSEKEKLAVYARYLVETNMVVRAVPASPNLELLVRALDEEGRLNFKLVEKERRDLVEQLANKLTVQQMQKLVAKSMDYRAGRVGYGDYHNHLIEICRQHGIGVGQWVHLNRYISYVMLADKIDKNGLLEEMDFLDRAIPERLARTADEKKLVAIAYDLTLMAKLLRHEMAPTDWAIYEKRADEIHRLADRLAEVDHTNKWESLSAKTLKPFEEFCSYATQRNNALADNLLRRMEETRAKSAVLVTGGFHTEGLSALLRDKQVSYVVLTPKITEIPRDNKYLDLLASDPVPLEKQLAGDRIYLAKVVGMTEKSTAGLMAAIQHVVQLKKAVVDMGNSFAITTDGAYAGAKVLFELGDGRKIYFVTNYKQEKPFLNFSSRVVNGSFFLGQSLSIRFLGVVKAIPLPATVKEDAIMLLGALGLIGGPWISFAILLLLHIPNIIRIVSDKDTLGNKILRVVTLFSALTVLQLLWVDWAGSMDTISIPNALEIAGGISLIHFLYSHFAKNSKWIKGAQATSDFLEGSFFIVNDVGNGILEKRVKSEVGHTEKYKLNEEDRRTLAALTYEFIEDIRDAVKRKTDGVDIIPAFELIDDTLRVRRVAGIPFKTISDKMKSENVENYADWLEKTRDQMVGIINAANAKLGLSYEEIGIVEGGWGIQVDPAVENNFLFDSNGNLVAWIDPIAVWPPKDRLVIEDKNNLANPADPTPSGAISTQNPYSLLTDERLARNIEISAHTGNRSSVLYLGGGYDLSNVLTTFPDATSISMVGLGYKRINLVEIKQAMGDSALLKKMAEYISFVREHGYTSTTDVGTGERGSPSMILALELLTLGVTPESLTVSEDGTTLSFDFKNVSGITKKVSVSFLNQSLGKGLPGASLIPLNLSGKYETVYLKSAEKLARVFSAIIEQSNSSLTDSPIFVINPVTYSGRGPKLVSISSNLFSMTELATYQSPGNIYGNKFVVFDARRNGLSGSVSNEQAKPAATIRALMPLYHWMGKTFNLEWSRIPAHERLEQIIEVYAPVVESVLFGFIFGGTLALLGFLGVDFSTLQTVGLWGAFNGIFALSHRTFYVLENGEWKEKSLAEVGKSTHLTLWAASLGVHLPLLGMLLSPAALTFPFTLSFFVSSFFSSWFHRLYNKRVARFFDLPALTAVQSDFNRARSLLFLLLKDLDDRDVLRIHSELITRYPSYKESAGELNSVASISTFWNQHLATTVGRSNDDRWTDFKNSLLSLSNPKISYVQDDPFTSGGFGEARLIKINGKDYILKTARHGQDKIPLLDAIFNIGSLLYEEKQLKVMKQLLSENKIPHFVPIYVGGGISNGRNFIVMERIKGENLNANSEISLQEALRIIDAVRWFHKNNKGHGDLKPLNIMITPEAAFLIDLGTTKQVGTKIAWDNVSTQEFSTGLDETRRGKNFNTDIYQLAATLVTVMNEDDLTRPKIFRVLQRALTGIELPSQTAFPPGFDTSEFRPSAEELNSEFIRSIEDQEQPEPNPFNKQKMIGELQIAKAWNWAEMQTLNRGANNIFYYIFRLFTSENIAKAWGMRLLPVEIGLLGGAGWFASGWAQVVFGALALDPTLMGAALMAAGIVMFRGLHFALEKVWARSHPAQGPPSKTFWLNTVRMMPYAMLPVLVSSPIAFLIAFSVLAYDHFSFDLKQLFNKNLPWSNNAKIMVISLVSATFAVVIAPIIVSNLASPMGTFFLVSLVAQAFDPVTLHSFSENPVSGLVALGIGTVSNFSTYALSMGWAPMALLGFATSVLLSSKIPSTTMGQAVNADALKAVISLMEGKNLGRVPENLKGIAVGEYRSDGELLKAESADDIGRAIRVLEEESATVEAAVEYGRRLALADGVGTEQVAVLHGILSWEQKTRDIALAVVRGMLLAGKPVLIVAEEGFDTKIINYSGQTSIEILKVGELTSGMMDSVESRKSNKNVPLSSTVLISEEHRHILDGTNYSALTFEGISRAIQNAIETLIATLRAA